MSRRLSDRVRRSLAEYRQQSRRGPLQRAYRRRFLFPSLEGLEPRLLLAGDLPAEILVGRTLSAYSVNDVQNNQLKLTYSVYNLREISIDEVRLTDTLKPGVTFMEGSQLPDENGQELTWSLGTIPAYGRATVEITVSLAAGNLFQLDEGAQVFGTVDAGVASDDAPPAILRSSPIIAAELASTADANATDPFIQEKAAELNYDPVNIFAYLRDDVGYESYVGSLRGARGTLWSAAGNALDEASLGVALFRASGIPARYAHGTLSDADAQALILTMFPEPTQIVGYLTPGTEVADPAHDPTLLTETRDHYWLQIDVGGGFQDADTSGLPGGGIGTAFTTIDDTFNEVADDLRHKVRISLDAETYSQAAAALAGSTGITTATVLDKTWNAVELVGRPISVSQFVDENGRGGLGLTARALTYTPYFVIGDVSDPAGINDDLTSGTPFQELLTNFPLASTVLTGLTLNIDLTVPGGSTEHLESMLVDRIGYAARQNSTSATLSVDANGKPALTNFDVVTVFASASESPGRDSIVMEATIRDQQARLQPVLAAGGALSPREKAELRSLGYNVSRLMGYRYLQTMDVMPERIAELSMVKAYWDRARIVLAKITQVPGTASAPNTNRIQMDLLHEFVRVIAAPGQSVSAEFGLRLYYGLVAGKAERAAVESVTNPNSHGEILSISSIFEAAQAQSIPTIVLLPQDRATLSSYIAAPPDVLARIDKSLASGKLVFAPASTVLLNGEDRLGWYEIDPQSGATIDVLDTGEHSFIEWGNQVLASITYDNALAFGAGFFIGLEVGAGIAQLDNLEQAIIGGVTTLAGFATNLKAIATNLSKITSQPLFPAFSAGFAVGSATGALIVALDPPAEGQYFTAILPPTSNDDTFSVTLSATIGQTLAVTPVTASTATNQNTPIEIPLAVVTDLAGDYTLTAIAPEGWDVSLSETSVTVTPAPGTQSGSGTVRIVARSNPDSSRVARAEIQVNVVPTAPGVSFDVPADPLFTVPYQGAELTTAYRAVIRNLGPAEDDYSLQFSNITPGWEVITSAAGVTLPAGTTGIVGVYLRPTGTDLPAPGTPVGCTVTVTSTSNPALTETVTVGFVMPTVAASYFIPDRMELSLVPNSTATNKITFVNRGNITETVTLTAGTLPIGFTITGLPITVTLSPDQIVEFPYSVTIADTVDLNSTAYLTLSLDKLRTGALAAETLNISIRVVIPGADAIAEAAGTARTLGKNDLADRLTALTIALTELAVDPTDPIANSQSVAALDAVIRIIDADPILGSLYSSYLAVDRDALSAATTTSAVQSVLDELAYHLDLLSQSLTDIALHGFTFSLATNVVTALPGVPARFPILLENKGTEPTTFDLSIVAKPTGVTATFDQASITLQPGERIDGGPGDPALNLSFSGFSGNTLFPGAFRVAATPQEAPSLAQQTSGSVAVRPEFVQVATVMPSPTFTQPGGMVAISARILNVVNREQVALVSYRVTDPSGATIFTSTAQAVTIGVQSSLMDVTLPDFDTTGLARSDYTISVLVADATGAPIPGGSGQATLLVGLPVSGTLTVSPDSLLSIESTVTNTLQLDAHTVVPNPLTLLGQVQTTPTATTILVSGNIAYVAGTNGIDIVNIADPSAPQVVGTFGQSLIVEGGYTVVRSLSADRIIVATGGVLNANSFTLLTYSIANPTAPVLLGQSTVEKNYLSDLFIVGDRALATTQGIGTFLGSVLSQFGDVFSLDLTDPNAVAVTDALLGNAANYNQNGGEVVDASTLYVASTTSTGSATQQGNGLVRIIDYSDPANLTQVGQLTIPGTVQALEIAVDGNRALVVGSTGGWNLGPAGIQLTGRMTLTLLDITDRLHPVVLGTTLVTDSLNRPVDTADGGAKLSMLALGNGRFAISRGYVNGQSVLLLADTTGDDMVVAAIDVPSLVNEMAIVNDTLYTTSQSGLLIYNLGAIEGTSVTVTVRVPNSNVSPNVNHVRADSFNIPPDQIIPDAGFDTLVWKRPLAFGTTSSTLTWQTDISGLTHGESREVTTGTEVSFVYAGTPGAFSLPATSVVGHSAVAISPVSQTVAPGTAATYAVTLTNPTGSLLHFTLSTSGVPSSWVDLPRTVFVNANSSLTETLRITAPAAAPNGASDFVVLAAANGAVQGAAQGTLTLDGTPIIPDSAAHGIVASIAPTSAMAGQGTGATYVVKLTNTGSETETFALSSVLPAGVTGAFESTLVTIPAGTSNFREITLVLTPNIGTAIGSYPFTVIASSTDSDSTNSATGEVQVVANGVNVELNTATGIPGDTFRVTVTNTGTVADTFDLTAAGPAGVGATLSASQLTLAPNQSQVVDVTTAPVNFAVPGSFNLTLFARSQSIPSIVDSDNAELDIQATMGLASSFDPESKVLSVPGTADFLLFVNNIGNKEDSYTATISATDGPIAASLIGLDGHPAQTIPIFRLPGLATGAILLKTTIASVGQGTVHIQVRSLTDDTILSESTATLSALSESATTVSIAAASADKAEGNSGNTPFTFTVTRSGDVSTATTVDFTVTGSGNTPADAADFAGTLPSGQVSFAANETMQTLTVPVRGDAVVETDESFTVMLSNASGGATIITSTAIGTIRNDDVEAGFKLTCSSLRVGLNTCTVSGATPGGIVNLALGIQPGDRYLSQFRVTLGMLDSTIVAQGIVQPDGRAVVQFTIATAQLLQQVLLQAFEQVPRPRTTNIVVVGAPLLASGGQLAGSGTVSPSDLPPLLAAAIGHWNATGLTLLENQLLDLVTVEIVDLPAGMLGRAVDQQIYLDNTAAGHGWFIDRTPADDGEFSMGFGTAGQATSAASAAFGHVDLLTVLLHELGHVLGRADISDAAESQLMLATLPDGTRRAPSDSSFTVFDPRDVNHDGMVTPMDALLIINQLNLPVGRTTQAIHSEYDVNRDGLLSPMDVLLVINYLNRSIQNSNGEGESWQLDAIGALTEIPETSIQSPSIDDDLLSALAADVSAWIDKRRVKAVTV